jgi:fatty acid desaturase
MQDTPDPVPPPPGRGLDRGFLVRASRATPVRLLCAVCGEWALIALAIAAALWCGHIGATVLAVLFIATRQHALLVLMHEFSHRNFSRGRPGLNDTLGDFLTALPFFVTVHGFRRDHSAHHAHTSTPGDPNWAQSQGIDRYTFPKSRPRMAKTVLLHVLGYYTLRDVKGFLFDSKMSVGCPRATRVRQWVFGVAVAALATWFHAWTVLGIYWLLPSLTALLALLYLREISEHFGLPREGCAPSRTMLLGRLERWLIAPYHVHYHAEHHVYPSIPAFRLPELHRLMSRQPGFTDHTVFTRGYAGLLRELGARR